MRLLQAVSHCWTLLISRTGLGPQQLSKLVPIHSKCWEAQLFPRGRGNSSKDNRDAINNSTWHRGGVPSNRQHALRLPSSSAKRSELLSCLGCYLRSSPSHSGHSIWTSHLIPLSVKGKQANAFISLLTHHKSLLQKTQSLQSPGYGPLVFFIGTQNSTLHTCHLQNRPQTQLNPMLQTSHSHGPRHTLLFTGLLGCPSSFRISANGDS